MKLTAFLALATSLTSSFVAADDIVHLTFYSDQNLEGQVKEMNASSVATCTKIEDFKVRSFTLWPNPKYFYNSYIHGLCFLSITTDCAYGSTQTKQYIIEGAGKNVTVTYLTAPFDKNIKSFHCKQYSDST